MNASNKPAMGMMQEDRLLTLGLMLFMMLVFLTLVWDLVW